jgi:lipoate-protein ligase A
MHFSNHSLPTPAENLALEEAWLDMAEEGQWSHEILRIWQPSSTFVVIGRGSRVAEEVNLPATEAAGIPVLRRSSGGAAIVAAPGCLMYAVLLSYEKRPHLRSLDQAHATVMHTLLSAIQPLHSQLAWDGTCDLVVQGRKVSGNSLRCRRDWLLYHGTILLAMDLTRIDQFLLHPPREPEYRHRRPHAEFVANLQLSAEPLIANLTQAWAAQVDAMPPIPHARIEQLVHQRYGCDGWNRQR